MSAERTITGLPEPQGRGEVPLYFVTRLYLLFLQGLFKQFPEGSYRWSPSEAESEIKITGKAPKPVTVQEQRPALVVFRGPAQWANLSLNKHVATDWKTGEQTFTDLIPCTMTIACIANKSEPEAERLAWIVMSSITRHKVLLQRNGLFKVGDEVSVGPPGSPGDLVSPDVDQEAVMVPVYSPFFFQWKEKGGPLDAVRLREIDAHIRVGLPPAIAETTKARKSVLRPPSIMGKPVVGEGIGESIPLDPPPVSTVLKVT